jgi:hypothetical protein
MLETNELLVFRLVLIVIKVWVAKDLSKKQPESQHYKI